MSATINEPTLDENYQLAGVCDRCRTVRPLFPVHYERGYQRLCDRCWARNMKFITRDAEEVGRNITLQIAQADAANWTNYVYVLANGSVTSCAVVYKE